MRVIILILSLAAGTAANAQWYNWEARVGTYGGELETMAADMSKKGFVLNRVHAHDSEGETKFATIWLQQPRQHAWQLRSDLSSEELQQAGNEFVARGYSPIDISVYKKNGAVRFTTIWGIDGANVYQIWSAIPAYDLKRQIDSFTRLGYTMTDIDGFTENGQRYFSGIWKKVPGLDWKYFFGFSESEFAGYMEQAARDSYVPVSLNAFEENGNTVFSGIVVHTRTQEARIEYDVKEKDLQSLVDEIVDQGYAITDIDSYGGESETRYTIVFSRTVKPANATPTVTAGVLHASQFSSNYLPIPAVQQQTQVWCWLAVGEMIFKQYGVPAANSANYQCGIIGSLNFVNPVCAFDCSRQECIVPSGSNYNTVRMLRDYSWKMGRVFSCREGYELPFSAVKNNIDNGKPILAGISFTRRQYYGGAEHAVLIVGYETTQAGTFLIVNDPFAYHTSSNPYFLSGGTLMAPNRYRISISDFTNRVFWHWSLYDISIN